MREHVGGLMLWSRATRHQNDAVMPRRTLLSFEQHTCLFGIAVHQAEMAKHYMLSMEDLALIRAKRRASNRLGFASSFA
jgi:Domain of unknown function (DUF4158)